MNALRDVFVCDAVRTPIGRYGGALANVRTDDLAAIPIKALISAIPGSTGRGSMRSCSAAPTRPARTIATSRAWRCCSRPAGHRSGRDRQPALRLRASMPSATLRAPSAPARSTSPSPAASKSMTRAPFVMGKAQEAFQRSAEIYDTTLGWRFINPLMKAQYGVDSMADTAENVAEDYQVSRADQDAFALRSQQRAGKAMAVGLFRRGDRRGRSAGRQGGPDHGRQGRASAPARRRSKRSPSSSPSRATPAR